MCSASPGNQKKLTIGAVSAQRIVRSDVLRPVGGTLHNLTSEFRHHVIGPPNVLA
jgi:hypothetical protein